MITSNRTRTSSVPILGQWWIESERQLTLSLNQYAALLTPLQQHLNYQKGTQGK